MHTDTTNTSLLSAPPARRHGAPYRAGFSHALLRGVVRAFPNATRARMVDAGFALTQDITLLAKQGHTAVHEVLPSRTTAEPWVQYPARMIEDSAAGTAFYYHDHGFSKRRPDERGHFHVFLRDGADRYSHLTAIAIDFRGLPVRVFSTNRWVTDEAWMPAKPLLALAARFTLVAAPGSVVLNRWITHCVRLFGPQLQWLISRRDERIAALESPGRCARAILEDRRVEVLSECRLSLPQQIQALQSSRDI